MNVVPTAPRIWRTAGRLAAAPCLLTLAALASQSAGAQTLITYDDFSGGAISPSRFYGEEGKQYGGVRVEARRVVAGGQLRIEAKGYSDNFANTGSSTTRNAVVLAKSAAITTLRSTVTMRSATVTSCAGNTTPSAARARLFGFFFNAGVPQPGSNYNDVFAGIQLSRASNSTDAAGLMRVTAFVGKCTDDSCIASTSLGSQDLGTVAINTPLDLQVGWDAASNRFSYQRGTDALVFLPYTVSDSQPASFPVKRLEISNQVAQCTATRQSVFGSADFDNVKTNVSPALRMPPLPRELEPDAVFDEVIGRIH